MLLLVDWWFWRKLLLYHFTVIPRSEKFFCIGGTWEMGWLCSGRIRQATQTLFSVCVGPWHYAWYGVFLLCGECCPNRGGVFVPHLSSLETLRFPLWRNMSIRESLTILNVMFTRWKVILSESERGFLDTGVAFIIAVHKAGKSRWHLPSREEGKDQEKGEMSTWV